MFRIYGEGMRNPCKECIIRVNCTQICWEKENQGSLIRNAVQLTMKQGKPNPAYLSQWQIRQHQYNRYLHEVMDIQVRARNAKEANF